MSLTRFDTAEIVRFLVALDDALASRLRVVVIGGSALALGYGVAAATSDVDTYESRNDLLDEAARVARHVTGLSIPIANSGIAQFPPGYDDRLVRVLPDLAHLELWVPTRMTLRPASCCAGTSTIASSSARSTRWHRSIAPRSWSDSTRCSPCLSATRLNLAGRCFTSWRRSGARSPRSTSIRDHRGSSRAGGLDAVPPVMPVRRPRVSARARRATAGALATRSRGRGSAFGRPPPSRGS